MPDTVTLTFQDLFQAVEDVRHRGMQKRVDSEHAGVPKETTLRGKDWSPCMVCRGETKRIWERLHR